MNKVFPMLMFIVILDGLLLMNGVITVSGTSLFYSIFSGNGLPGFSNSTLYSNMNNSLTTAQIGTGAATISGLVIAGTAAVLGKTDIAIAAAIGSTMLVALPDLGALYNIIAVISPELATFIVAVLSIAYVFCIWDWVRTPLA